MEMGELFETLIYLTSEINVLISKCIFGVGHVLTSLMPNGGKQQTAVKASVWILKVSLKVFVSHR